MEVDTIDLYTVKDVQRIRELLFKEQNGLDLLTGLPIPENSRVLDHNHNDEQLVRGVLHRFCNTTLGKIEGLYSRYLSFWYKDDLQTFLRKTADYLDLEQDTRYRHPNFQKKLKVFFNKLNALQQNKVLVKLGGTEGSNPAKRKEIFGKLVLDRSLGYEVILSAINQVKGE